MNPTRCLLLLAACVLAADARAEDISVGVHLASIHSPQREQNNTNPGLYGRYRQWVVGGYRNSDDRDTFYLGYEFNLIDARHFELGLLIGAATGYDERCTTTSTYVPASVTVEKTPSGDTSKATTPAHTTTTETCTGFARGWLTPLGALSLAPKWDFPVTPRLTFLPGFGKTSAVYHLSLETKF